MIGPLVDGGLPAGTLQPAVILSILAVLGLIANFIYNLRFSPLASFPGPTHLAISKFPQLFVTLSGKQLPWLIRLHNSYGGVVRIAPDTLSFTDERAWHDICGSTKYAKEGMPKDPKMISMLGGELLSPDPHRPRHAQPHGIMRRAMVAAQRHSNVRELGPLIDRHIEEWLSAMAVRCQSHGVADMNELPSFFICNLFFDLLLGEKIDLFNDPAYRSWVHSFDRFAFGVTLLSLLNHFPMAHKPLLFMVRRWGDKERRSFLDPVYSIFDRRMQVLARGEKHRGDMLEMMLEDENASTSDSKNATMPKEMLREFTPFLLLGACDPLPGFITAITYYVFRRSSLHIRERLLREVRNKFTSEQDITVDSIAHSAKELPYLEACFSEVVRCYAPGIGAERVVPDGGAMVAGRWVPGGTIVVMQHQPQYLLRENFTCADQYIPERWLPSEDERSEFAGDRRSCLHPFSVGPSSCPGQEIASVILRLAVCKMLFRYDIELDRSCENWDANQVTYTTRVRPPLMVRARQANV
ncbi:Cytochrome-P450 monooxygenase [Teratosphaeria destructans]|uniref:Cytochrome-P450 monooxygenase n=1 Tax=Teratosphaeria destructans TaxID=418781 RepID=A0A9W7SZW8_9PEZI|nr:Cytochrome-P450 monooxygenase [Teratosphaeria destructans]